MSTNDIRQVIAAWVDNRLKEMLGAPRMWGAGLEAVELQMLTLLEVRALASNVERELECPRRILDEYVRLLGERYKKRPAQPLHDIVGVDGDAEFVEVMRELSTALSDKEPGGDFFSQSYVGIELLFKPGQFLSAQTVTSFYEDFRRATRSLARVGTGRTGRVEKSIEAGTDFELEAVQITPLNGVPARARLALGAPYGQLDMESSGRVQRALSQMLEIAERADATGSAALHDFGGDLGAEARTRALVQTLRILPRGGIEEVKIGGAYLARPPVSFRRVHAPKVIAAVADDTEPTLYDETALIRSIDLDRGLVMHGRGAKDRVSCYVPPEDSDKVTRVGVLARIVGKRYQPQNSQSFVIAEEIDIIADRANAHTKQQKPDGELPRQQS